MPLDFRVVPHNSADYWSAVELRRNVLRAPLGLNFLPEELASETEHFHLVGSEDGEVIACLVLQPVSERTIKMRQVAVHPDKQKGGIGSQLIRFSEAAALHYGFAEITLHARANVVPFYLRLGYEAYGEPFEEVTISHRAMKKILKGINETNLTLLR